MSRLIEKLDEGEHLQPSDDGYIVYWAQRGGYLTASHLREIADELDRRNKTWHEQVTQDVGPPMPKIKPLVWIGEGGSLVFATTAIGDFKCQFFKHANQWSVASNSFSGFAVGFAWFDSLEEAKAACEQEYERRVRECLE